ncbi:MAG: hypothetical protein NT139_00500 [Candidatus Woesearchaeota archaeon]|nr:hypothetical protein [Candidatus Woesearchaeota archaeon]
MKKGVSEVISWVLLLGFSVLLGTTVILWSKQQTEKYTDELTEMVENDINCRDVIYTINANCTTKTTSVNNRGSFTIVKFIIRTNLSSTTLDTAITPSSTVNLGIPATYYPPNNNGGFDMIPFIEVNNKKIGCTDKARRGICKS